jgi:hypothetical protein
VTRGVPGLPEVAEVLSGFLPEIGVFAYAREKVNPDSLYHFWAYSSTTCMKL